MSRGYRVREQGRPGKRTYEVVADEVVVQHHEADHGQLGQVDLELKALVEDGVPLVLGHGAGAALGAVGRDAVDLHVDVGLHHVPLGPRAQGPGQVLPADHLEGPGHILSVSLQRIQFGTL